MSLLIYEIILLISLFVFSTVVFLIALKKKNTTAATISVVITLVEVFVIIHLLFCYQIGFPASKMQDNTNDLILSASDWLAFLGGYLGFAGSFVMAYLVYRQSTLINKLTISEYAPCASLRIQCSVICSEHKKYIKDNILQSIPNNENTKYYTLHYSYVGEPENDWESKILVYAEVENNSKSTIYNLSFDTITLESLVPNQRCYKYKNNVAYNKMWDPVDGEMYILPGRCVKRCFVIDTMPSVIEMGWLDISFMGDKKNNYYAKVLISKERGRALTFLDESNSFLINN